MPTLNPSMPGEGMSFTQKSTVNVAPLVTERHDSIEPRVVAVLAGVPVGSASMPTVTSALL
jgi:hypothetical protein